ncbi:unnamed protein product [Moneuplotes crassus]|uniref:Uncharacterized protein n=1 Tax=Euplotes crassus TaxID=5936 RepID=A0AAD1UF18_EUPCR|nr:unnamed protein product [Moneuplotes crassus]
MTISMFSRIFTSMKLTVARTSKFWLRGHYFVHSETIRKHNCENQADWCMYITPSSKKLYCT